MMPPVSRDLGTVDAPTAVRARGPGWRDPRLWLGIALVAASVLVGARLLGGADDTVEVWSVDADLAAGQPVTEGDLVARRVRFDDDADGDRYLRVGDPLPDDATLSRAVGAGELLPAAALGATEEGLTEVPVWAPAEVIPASIESGSVVDVWVTPTPGASSTNGSVLVLDDVVVIAVPRGEDSFGPGGNRQVLVGVTDGAAPEVGQALAAAKDNRIVITRQG
jgi:hypothetical protein